MFVIMPDSEVTVFDSCPACGDPFDYCTGHGVMGDPSGFEVIVRHYEQDDHTLCHPDGCNDSPAKWFEYNTDY